MSTIKFLKQEEKGRLFGSVDTDERRHAVRNRAIIYLAEYCGLRATEVCLLKMDDYDTLQSSIYCTRLKKGNDNTIRIIDPRVQAAINDYLNTVSYTHLRAHETDSYLVCRLLLEKKKKKA